MQFQHFSKMKKILFPLLVLVFIFSFSCNAFAVDIFIPKTDLELCRWLVQNRSIYDFDASIFKLDSIEKIMVEVQKQDRYADYYTPEEYQLTMADLEGKKVATGIQTTEINGHVEIVGFIDGSPASLSGLKVGDIITHVDGDSIVNLSYKDAVLKMQGEEGTELNVTVSRDGESLDFSIIRLNLYIPSIEKEMLDETTGYIRILEFTEGTDNFVESAIKEMQKQGMEGLILDLRGCPGGLLTSTAGTADLFIPKGPIIFVEEGSGNQYYYRSFSEPLGIPLVVLVDGNTASGAEVLAGDIKDSGVGLLVGEKTYGKGTVQNFFELSDGSAIKMTTARYYTRNYYDVAGNNGIVPDIDLTGDWYAQLEKARELLANRMPYGEAVYMKAGSKELNVGDRTISLPAAPFLGDNGSFYVPLRQTAEAMNVIVEWKDNEIVLSLNGQSYIFDLSKQVFHKGGFDISVKTYQKEGTCFVPVRLLADTFGWELHYDKWLQSIEIKF